MTADSVLNSLWLLTAVVSLLILAAAELRRRRGTAFAARFRRALAVAVVLIAIFPTLSATDDIAELQRIVAGAPATQQVSSQRAANSGKSAAFYLAQLFRGLQNSRVSWMSWPLAHWHFGSLAELALPTSYDRSLCLHATRAPPSSSPA